MAGTASPVSLHRVQVRKQSSKSWGDSPSAPGSTCDDSLGQRHTSVNSHLDRGVHGQRRLACFRFRKPSRLHIGLRLTSHHCGPGENCSLTVVSIRQSSAHKCQCLHRLFLGELDDRRWSAAALRSFDVGWPEGQSVRFTQLAELSRHGCAHKQRGPLLCGPRWCTPGAVTCETQAKPMKPSLAV